MWQFFYPRAIWRESKYGVSLKVTQSVAEASNGGVLYYFCHIHSKMSGKIQIMNAGGTKFTNAKAEKELYSPPTIDPVDSVCGTSSVAPYAGAGSSDCGEQFLCGALDTFEPCVSPSCRDPVYPSLLPSMSMCAQASSRRTLKSASTPSTAS